MSFGISKKLIGTQVAGLLFFVVLAVFSYIGLNSYSSIQKRQAELSARMELVADLQLLTNRILMPPNDYLITGDKKERAKFAVLVMSVSSLFERVKTGQSGIVAETAIIKDVQKEIIELEEKAMVLLSTEKPVGNKEAAVLMEEMDAFALTVQDKIERFHDAIRSETNLHAKMAAEISTRVIKLLTALTILFTAGLIYLIYFVRKGVAKPISELTDAVKIVGQGNLDHQITIKTGDEIEGLGRAFNNMAWSLKEKINEVKEYSAKLEKLNRRLDQNILQLYTLYNISKTIAVTSETENLLNQVANEVKQALKIHKINIMLINKERTVMRIAAGLGIPETAMDKEFHLDEGIYGRAAVTGQTVIINNPAQDPRFTPTDGLDNDISSLIVAPFKGRSEVIGILNAYKLGGEFFDEPSFDLLTAAASQIGLTLENAQLFEETRTLAITDGLTSLYNHRYFMKSLSEEFERAKRYKRALSLIMIDVDFFKRYNDAYGHPKGDKLLTELGGIMKKSARSTDTVARYGGEEFAVILPETDGKMALNLAERLRKEVEATDFCGAQAQPAESVTISLGVSSLIEGQTKDIDELIKNADNALYRAKEEGRNRVCLATC